MGYTALLSYKGLYQIDLYQCILGKKEEGRNKGMKERRKEGRKDLICLDNLVKIN